MTRVGTDDATQRVRRFYEARAGEYDLWLDVYDRWLRLPEARRALLSRARGRTLELGVGTGRNLPFYPDEVQLTGIDLSQGMLARASARAKDLGFGADLRIGDAYGLDFPNDTFDTAVATLAMSSIPDGRRAASELHRVLKPGGVLLLLDHVPSPHCAVRLIERAIDPLTKSLWSFSLMRDPLDSLEAVGFAIEHCERTRLGVLEAIVARKG